MSGTGAFRGGGAGRVAAAGRIGGHGAGSGCRRDPGGVHAAAEHALTVTAPCLHYLLAVCGCRQKCGRWALCGWMLSLLESEGWRLRGMRTAPLNASGSVSVTVWHAAYYYRCLWQLLMTVATDVESRETVRWRACACE